MQSVYGLVDPRDDEIFYIGKAIDVRKRFAHHLYAPHQNDAKNKRLSELKQLELSPLLFIIEENIDDDLIHEREKHWILYYQAKGAPLTNIIYGLKDVVKLEHKREYTMMEQKDTYDIQELFALLPIAIAELARRSGINEVTLARMRDGRKTRRDTVNKLLLELSKVYERPLSIRNVTGLNAQVNKRLDTKQTKQEDTQIETLA